MYGGLTPHLLLFGVVLRHRISMAHLKSRKSEDL
jgi:hypothetical protein